MTISGRLPKGIGKMRSHRWQRAWTVPPEPFDLYCAETCADPDGEVTTEGLLRVEEALFARSDVKKPARPTRADLQRAWDEFCAEAVARGEKPTIELLLAGHRARVSATTPLDDGAETCECPSCGVLHYRAQP